MGLHPPLQAMMQEEVVTWWEMLGPMPIDKTITMPMQDPTHDTKGGGNMLLALRTKDYHNRLMHKH